MTTRRSFLMSTAATGVLVATNAIPEQLVETPRQSMRRIKIPQTDLTVSRIAYGCATLVKFDRAPLNSESRTAALRAINVAYDHGVNLFDLADHYGFFKSEAAFGEILKRTPGFRNKIVLQSKCGVRYRDDWESGRPSHFFDCSYANIIHSVEGSLRRLQTDRLDILLLHYPDALVEPEEVAKAFDELKASGKVRYFGVSNHTASQIELLKKYVRPPLVVNQLRLGLSFPDALADGLNGNLPDSKRAIGVIDYCRLCDIGVQAYSSLRGELLNPPPDAGDKVREAAHLIRQMAEQRSTSPWALGLAWLLRHPANIIPIIGSTNPRHIADNCSADTIRLDRDDWYQLLVKSTQSLMSR